MERPRDVSNPTVLNMLWDPGRRVHPKLEAATITGVDMRGSYNAERNAPPFLGWSSFRQIISHAVVAWIKSVA